VPPLQCTQSDGVAVVRLDRPERRNAMDTALLDALLAALDELAADADLRVLVVSSTDVAALSAGADVREALDPAGAVGRMERFTRLYATVEAFPVPTIAVCVGNCVGAGAEIVAGADLRVGGDNLKLAWAGARLGVPVGPARLAPLIGLSRAKELIYTGRVVGMDEAVALGLLHRTASAAAAEQTAVELARELTRQSPSGLRTLKQMFRDLESSADRVAYENEHLLRFQQHGAGLPRS